jgi:hypothetical protein
VEAVVVVRKRGRGRRRRRVGLSALGRLLVLKKAGWSLRLRLCSGLRQLGTHSCPKCEGMNGAPGGGGLGGGGGRREEEGQG